MTRNGPPEGSPLEPTPQTGEARRWISEPEQSDAVIRENTGRGWDEWRDLIDAWPGNEAGHAAVATWLQEEHGVPGWWAQSVTVGWERITGRRLPHQVADGTFTANRSATITTDPVALRERLLSEDGRADLLAGLTTQLRSKPTSKNVRIGLDEGVVEFAIAAKDGGQATIHISHAKLTAPKQVAHWKAFWGTWLEALGG